MMTVLKSVRSRKFLAALSVLVSVAAMLVGARVAVADSIWYQSYQRGSASEACVAQAGETPWQDSWGTNPGWSPSWEQWANNGQGGWVCSRSITWARDSAALVYNLGDIGPGGGLVFLISGGKTYEMAPKTWNGGSEDPLIAWCSDYTNSVSTNTAIGTGSANTTAMLTSASPFMACTLSAPNAVRAYNGGGYTDWFLPSQDELNAMCNYSRNPTAPAAPSESCYGIRGTTQDGTFAAGTYGFANYYYWSSSQGDDAYGAWSQELGDGSAAQDNKAITDYVRPVRAF
jgi:hypothetical protein